MPGCAVADTNNIQSRHAERIVLAALLREGREFASKITLTRGEFYFDQEGYLFDVCLYCANGRQSGPLLLDVFLETRLRTRQKEACGRLVSAQELGGIWTTELWLVDMNLWADITDRSTSFVSWCGLAAAAKVEHLAARRRAIHAANELIRDALSPTGDAEYLKGRTDAVADEEYE